MKKFFTRSLCTLAMLLIATIGWAQKQVLVEQFNGTTIPTGWNTAKAYWGVENGTAAFVSMVENAADTLFSPMVNLEELKNEPTLTLDYRIVANGEHINPMVVMCRAAAEEDWQVLDTLDEAKPQGDTLSMPLPATMNKQVQVAFVATYQLGGETAIDAVVIANKKELTQAPANFLFENLNTTSATLRWGVCMSDYWVQNTVKVSTEPITDFSLMADVYDDACLTTYLDLTSLQPNTTYYAYVRFEAEDEDYSPWAELVFTTPCESMELPMTTDFENGLEDCYKVIKGSTTAAVNATYPYNSSKSFQFLNKKGTRSYLFFPAANTKAIKDYQLTFMVASDNTTNDYSRELTIGVAEDATAETFTEVKPITLPIGRRWEKVSISLASYKGQGNVVAFRAGNDEKENHIFIDDVQVIPAEDCLMPMFVNATGISSNTATISWVEAGNSTEWNLLVAQREYNNPSEVVADPAKGEFKGKVNTNPYNVQGLLPNTEYFVYVSAACSDSWTEVISFKTAKEVKIPYKEAFDRFDPEFYTDDKNAVPESWVVGARCVAPGAANYDKEYTTNYLPYVVSTKDNTESAYVPAALYLRGTSKSSTATNANYSSYAMLPSMPVDVKNLMVSFYAQANSTTTKIIVGVATNQSNEIEAGAQLALGGNVTPVDTLTFTAANQWEQFNVPLHTYAGAGKYITFYLVPGSSTPSVYVDDIMIDYAPTCFAVTGLTATPTSTNSIKVEWSETLKETSWNIKVASQEIDPATTDGDIVAKQTVTEQEYVVNNLVANTTYYVYVSPACGNEWKSTQATTLYALTVPYYNDFTNEPTGTGKKPAYWITGNVKSTSTTYIPNVNTTAMSAATGTTIPADITKPCLYFYSTKNYNMPYAIMPELQNAAVKDVTISFYGHTNQTNTTYGKMLRIGVMTDPTDITTLTPVTTVRLKTPKVTEFFTVNMAEYTGDGKYIVFYNDTTAAYTYFMLDNLSVKLSSAPQRVTDLEVVDTTITTSSATLQWKENGMATNWKVWVFAEKPTDLATATPWKEIAVSGTPSVALTGLDHSTQYTVYVQSVQGTEVGDWSSSVSFYTECDKWALPFKEGFEAYEVGSSTNNTLSPCYDVSNSSASNFPHVKKHLSSYGGNAIEGNGEKCFYMTAGSSKKAQLTLPALNKPVNTLQMTLLAGAYSSYATQSKTTIGVVTADGVFHPYVEKTVTTAKVWEEWFVDFSAYEGEDGCIAFYQEYDATAKKQQYICLDNIVIEQIPQCKRVQGVEVSGVAQNTATITWPAAGEETAWNLKVSSVELDDPSAAIADGFDGLVNTTTQALNTLKAGTEYFVYVQSVRADKECVGDWSAMVSFTTFCDPVALPYKENFESYEKDVMPNCYIFSGNVTNNTAAAVVSHTSYTGGMSLKLSQTDKEFKNYCIFPAVQMESLYDVQLKMNVHPGAWGTEGTAIEKCSKYYYEIGVMTDPMDPATYVAVVADSIVANGLKTGVDKRYTFDNYAGDELGNMGKYIAIKVLPYKGSTGSEYAGTIYIDNIEIGEKELCLMPTLLSVKEFSNDTVALTWLAEDTKGDFRVRVYDTKDAIATELSPVADVVVKDTTLAVIKGLDGNTTYYAYVRKECGDTNGNSLWSTPTSWHTECDTIQTLPYVENFEAYAANAAPNCWTSLDGKYTQNGSHQTATVSSKVSTSAAKEGSNGLSISYGSGESSAISMAITPRLDVTNMKNLVIYFDVKAATQDGQLLIEAVESPSEDAAAITIKAIENISKTSWTTIYLDLADYYTSVQPYQYLRFTPLAKTTIYMDNLHITTNKAELVPVYDLMTTNVASNQATIAFSEATPQVTQWVVEYDTTGFALGTGKQMIVDTKNVTLANLEMATKYDVYVRANVEGATFTGPCTFSTIKPAAALPYYYGFENAEENNTLWTLVNNKPNSIDKYPNTFMIGDAASAGATGDNALYVSYNGQYGYICQDTLGNVGASNLWATRYVEIPAKGTYVVGVKAKAPGNPAEGRETSDYMAMSLVPASYTAAGSTFTRPDKTTRSATAATNADKNEFLVVAKTAGVKEFTEFEAQAVVTEPGTYQLAIYWYNASVGINAGDIYQPVAVDSVWVEEYDCTNPTNHTLADLTESSATIEWFAGKNTQFEVVVSRCRKARRPNDMDEADKLVHTIFEGAPSFTVANLLPNTTYAFYQRTLCTDGPTDWVEFDFTTNCVDETLPYTENFIETPTCWTLSSGVKATTIKYLSDAMEAADEDAELWPVLSLAAKGFAILPDFGVDLNELRVEIAATIGTYPSSYTLGTVENPWDTDSFESLMTVQLKDKQSSSNSEGNPYILNVAEKMMNKYTGKGKYLAIRGANDQLCYIKYVKVTKLPECITPQQVEVTNITATSATIHWLTDDEQVWDIACGGDTIEVTTQPYTLTGLSQGQDYQVSVRAKCDDTHVSEWTTPVAFTTECGVHSMPLKEDFLSYVNEYGTKFTFVDANCWQTKRSTISLDSLNNLGGMATAQAKNAIADLLLMEKYYSTNSYYAWRVPYRENLDNYFGGKPHMQSVIYQNNYSSYYGTYYKWLLLPEYAVAENTKMSFDLAVANIQGNLFLNNLNGKYNVVELVDLSVIVSTDGGNNFTELKRIDLDECDSTFQRVSVDLTAYAGQNVVLGFYHPMKYSSTFVAPNICIADLRLNCYEAYAYEDNVCLGRDYQDKGFSIAATELPAEGEKKAFERLGYAENGCDSIITLTLEVFDTRVDTIYETICEGESYVFGGMTLTQSNPEGQPYAFNTESSVGCDSITYLYLTVAPVEVLTVDTVITTDQLPFIYEGEEILDANTPAGTYTKELEVEGTCTTIKLSIRVDQLSAIDRVTMGDLRLYPTIVEVGGAINLELGTMNPNDMTVEVYDALGKRIATYQPTTQVMTLKDFQTSGVFIIKVSSAKGEAFVEHVLVK